MRARGSLRRLGALVLTAGAMLGGAACSLVAGLDKLSFSDTKACGEACDDGDPCTDDDCMIDGVCEGTPVPDGPVPADPKGDCQQVTCAEGEMETTPDDTDVPDDDGNICTEEVCADGKPGHAARPDSFTCVASTGLAGTCSAGVCQVKCDADAACDDHNLCTLDTCDAAAHVCMTKLLEGTAVPPTLNDCDDYTCTSGSLITASKPVGTTCTFGGGRVCDGMGHCVACNVVADCPPSSKDECSGAACSANKTCGVEPAPKGKLLVNAPQQAGDCVTLFCDGKGGTTSEDDDKDLPPDDGNPCTINGCTDGAITSSPAPINTDCGAGKKCNATGLCKKAAAQACAAGVECLSGFCADGVCCNSTCTTACRSCALAASPGTCSNLASGAHDTNPANACVGVNFCDSAGVCKLGAGQPCTLAAQCISNMCPAGVCQ